MSMLASLASRSVWMSSIVTQTSCSVASDQFELITLLKHDCDECFDAICNKVHEVLHLATSLPGWIAQSNPIGFSANFPAMTHLRQVPKNQEVTFERHERNLQVTVLSC